MPKLVRQKAASHGYGVFCCEAINKDTHVLTMSGKVLDASEVTDDMRAMQIGPQSYLVEDIAEGDDGSQDCYLDNYLNHSCEPNVGFTEGDLRLFSLREIAQGQELLWDYSTSMNETGWSLPCFCGSASCRGRIESHDALAPEQQAKLRPIVLNYLREK